MMCYFSTQWCKLANISRHRKNIGRQNVTEILSHSSPLPEEFSALRKSVDWGETHPKVAIQALDNSLFHVVARQKEQLIGMGRVVGDGALFFYIQDLVVHPDFQHQGVGKALMKHIEAFIQHNAEAGATIGLFAAKGKEVFYQKFGYSLRDGIALGHGMCKFL